MVKIGVKIGIYDRYLATAGGGERYSCKMAEILSKQKNYQVDLITDLFTDLEKVSSRLNLDLSSVNLKVFPFLSEEYVRKITGDYDIFVNATYLSSLTGNGKRNLYLCYFPTPFDIDFKPAHRFLLIFFRLPAIWLYRFADRISHGFGDIEIVEGIYDVKRFYLRRGSWSSGKVVLIYKNSGSSIKIGLKNPQVSGIESMKCRLRIYKKGSKEIIYNRNYEISKGCKKVLEFKPDIGGNQNGNHSNNTGYILEIESDTFFPEGHIGNIKDTRKLGVVLYDERKIGIIKKIILKTVGFIPLFLVTYPRNLKFLDTYNKIISISEYSQKWVKRLWARDSIILYPPVDVEKFTSVKKEKIILTVGRFFPEHHNKKQFELVQNFIELYKQHKDIMEGFELYLAGGVEDRTTHLEYVEKVKEISKGYPIKIMTNIEWAKLVKLFSKSLIFWHAAGMGEDKDRHPEKFEHFGITTVEAMASGCIPVTINMGGQAEIIKDGFDGFLFDSWEQLKNITLKICKKEIDYNTISNNTVLSSKKFSSLDFKKKLLEIIEEEVSKL
jgi:glycosyltransferase involved in cell wall biosynthesis